MESNERYAGRYELTRKLGHGGMGEVWLARDLELQSEIALKFLKESFSEKHTGILRRETRQARMLTHRHILRLFDFIHPEGQRAAISMEYAPGGTLAERTTPEKLFFEVAEIEDWILQTCEAIAYLHEECGIVHRDIKPGNLMIDAHGRIKVSDFGLSAGMDSLTLDEDTQETIGELLTLHYASPQLIWNPHESHHLNDIYALGVTIFQLLTGTYPFINPKENRWPWDRKNLLSMSVRRNLKGRGTESIPEHWDLAVARCLAEDPMDRPASARELAALLTGDTEILSPPADTDPPAPSYSTISIPSRHPRRESVKKISRSLLWVVVFSVLIGLLSGILWGLAEFWNHRSDHSSESGSGERPFPTKRTAESAPQALVVFPSKRKNGS